MSPADDASEGAFNVETLMSTAAPLSHALAPPVGHSCRKYRICLYYITLYIIPSSPYSAIRHGVALLTRLGMRWPSGTVPDLRSRGRRFESHSWLQCTKLPTPINSACHPTGSIMSSSLRAKGWRHSAPDWGGSMSVVLRRGSTLVRYCGHWMVAYRVAVPLAHANQLPLPRL